MKVTLNIENDAELRAYIKDCIKGQVMSIVRDEFKIMIEEELKKKIKGTDSLNFISLMKDALRIVVEKILFKQHNVLEWNTTFIKPFVNERLNKVLDNKDWNKIVDEAIKEKLRLLLNK